MRKHHKEPTKMWHLGAMGTLYNSCQRGYN
jgi:hypothetical protein